VTSETLLRLALVPAAVWLASLAARRWGHAVSGYLGGLPLIGGPITLFLALDHGPAFAATSALVTLAAILGQAAHLTTFARVGARAPWPVALLSGWTAFVAVAIAVSLLPLTPLAGLALAVAGLLAAWRWLPRIEGDAPPPRIPAAELRVRLVAAFALAVLIVWSARTFGPVVSGILLSLPVTGSIMPPFTLALYGQGALARLMRGFVVGLSGFTAFFFVVSATLPRWGVVAAFTAAICGALAAVFAVSHLATPRKA
jgi:hypothetical protein